MAARSCGNVNAGTDFFPRPQFAVEIPGGDQREGLMVVPAAPGANLIVRQTALALAPLQAFFNAMFRFGDLREFAARRIGRSIAEVIVMLHRTGFVA